MLYRVWVAKENYLFDKKYLIFLEVLSIIQLNNYLIVELIERR